MLLRNLYGQPLLSVLSGGFHYNWRKGVDFSYTRKNCSMVRNVVRAVLSQPGPSGHAYLVLG